MSRHQPVAALALLTCVAATAAARPAPTPAQVRAAAARTSFRKVVRTAVRTTGRWATASGRAPKGRLRIVLERSDGTAAGSAKTGDGTRQEMRLAVRRLAPGVDGVDVRLRTADGRELDLGYVASARRRLQNMWDMTAQPSPGEDRLDPADVYGGTLLLEVDGATVMTARVPHPVVLRRPVVRALEDGGADAPRVTVASGASGAIVVLEEAAEDGGRRPFVVPLTTRVDPAHAPYRLVLRTQQGRVVPVGEFALGDGGRLRPLVPDAGAAAGEDVLLGGAGAGMLSVAIVPASVGLLDVFTVGPDNEAGGPRVRVFDAFLTVVP